MGRNQSGRHGRSVSALIFLAAEDRGLQEAISPAEGFAGASQPLGHGVHHTDRKEPDCMQYQQDREQVYLHIHLTRKQFSYTISYIYIYIHITSRYVMLKWCGESLRRGMFCLCFVPVRRGAVCTLPYLCMSEMLACILYTCMQTYIQAYMHT